jgi:hypothetical protein
MPKTSEDVISARDILEAIGKRGATITTVVARKANIGNFENIDVGVAADIPVEFSGQFTPEQFEELKEACAQAAEIGFAIASEETFSRYMQIKEQIAAQKAE